MHIYRYTAISLFSFDIEVLSTRKKGYTTKRDSIIHNNYTIISSRVHEMSWMTLDV